MMKNKGTQTKKGMKGKMKKSILFTVIAVFTSIASIIGYTLANQSVQVEVKPLPNIDIVLTKSRSSVDLTNFTPHLKAKLMDKGVIAGIDDEKIRITDIKQEEVNLTQAFDWTNSNNNDVSSVIGAINPSNNGANVSMVGNPSKPGKNAIYIIPESQQDNEISFDYNIDFGDSFNAAGILVSTKREGNELKGYMISFNNVAWANAAGGANGGIWEYRYVLGANGNHLESKTLIDPLNISKSGRLTIKTTSTTISITGGGLPSEVITPMSNYYGSGFGFFAEHYEHGCQNIGKFDLRNISVKSTIIKSFNEVIKSPDWREDSIRIIVNVSDIRNDEFQDTNPGLAKILSKLLNDDVHFIGWANSSNRSEMQSLVQKNDRKGIVTDNTEYGTAIEDTAQYIKKLLDEVDTNGYIIAGEPVYVGVTPEELMNNTITEDYPEGSWKVVHDDVYFENGNGQYEKTNMYTPDIIKQFDKVGKYTITYQDEGKVAEVYAHRRPKASFSMRLNGTNVTLSSTSSDLDKQSENNGIKEEEWSYKKVTDTNWTNGKLTEREEGKDYIIKLRVKDFQNTWSKVTTKYISATDNDPIAEFKLAKNEVSIYNKLEVLDESYDPAGRRLVKYDWKVENAEGNVIYTDTTPLLDYKRYGLGKYTMKLIVTNQDNRVSEEYSQTFEIVDDTTAPELAVRPISGESINEPIEVNFKFTDEESGFDYYKYAISEGNGDNQSEEVELQWSENIYKQVDTIKLTEVNKELYIHLIGVDKNGNQSTVRKVGPYVINDLSFNLEIDVTDMEDPDMLLGGAEFSLIHPKQDSPDERIILYGTSDENGVCYINGKVMGVGTYEYIIYETNAPAGYDSAGLASLKITFDEEGRISKVLKQYNESIELVEYTSSNILLSIGCKVQDSNKFNLKVELVDERDQTIKVSNAKYKILTQASSGEKVTLTRITNADGVIYVEDKLTGRGEIVIYLEEQECDGYIVDKELKTIVIQRDKDTGELAPVRWKSDSYIDVNCEGNDVIIKLTAVKKASENTISVQLLDSTDPSVTLGGIEVRADQFSMGIRMQGTTNSEGKADLKVTSAVKGTYEYVITALNMPLEYDANLGTIRVQVKYDQDGNIIGAADAEGTTLETIFEQQITDTTVNNVALIKIGVNRSAAFMPYNFQIHKTDKNTGDNISDTEYEIKTKSGPLERVAKKTTDAWGATLTEISATNGLVITVTEKVARRGYILDPTPKTFTLQVNDGTITANIVDGATFQVNINPDAKLITFEDTNTKKMDGAAKAQTSFFITKKSKKGDLLQNIKLKMREIQRNQNIPAMEAITDDLGKAKFEGIRIGSEGKYVFEIEEVETVAGFVLPDTKILVEVMYEVKDGEMYVSSVIVKKGEKYITEKRYTQYETQITYQSDIYLTILSEEGEDIGPSLQFNIENIDFILDKSDADRTKGKNVIEAGEYEVVVKYPDRNNGIGTMTSTKTIRSKENLRVVADREGRTIVEFIEKTTPTGFIADAKNKAIQLRVKTEGEEEVPYIEKILEINEYKNPEDKKFKDIDGNYIDKNYTEIDDENYKRDPIITAELQHKINIDFRVETILQVKSDRTRKEMPFTLKIITDLKDIQDVYPNGIEVEVSVGGVKQSKKESNTNNGGILEYTNLTGLGDIEIYYQETKLPDGFEPETEFNKDVLKKIVINRNKTTYHLQNLPGRSNVPEENVVTDDVTQEIIVYMKKQQEFKINIEKVDSSDDTIKLEGADFDISSSYSKQATKQITTDSSGKATAKFEPVIDNRIVTYTIKETGAPLGYRKNTDLQLQVEFNEIGTIKNYKLIDPNNRNQNSVNESNNVNLSTGNNQNNDVNSNADYDVGWAEIDTPIRHSIDLATGGFVQIDAYKGKDGIDIIIRNSDRFNFTITKIDSRATTNPGETGEQAGTVYITGAEFKVDIVTASGQQIYSGTKSTVQGKLELTNLLAPVDEDIIIKYKETQAPYGYVAVDANDNTKEDVSGEIVIRKDAQNQLSIKSSTTPMTQLKVDNIKGELELVVENRAKFEIGLTTVDALTSMGLNGAKYIITNSESATGTVETVNGGYGSTIVGSTYQSKTVTYRIQQVQEPTGYSQIYQLIDDIVIEVVFGAEGNPISHRILEGENRVNSIEFPSKTSSMIQGNNNQGNTIGGNTIGGNTIGGNTIGGNTIAGNTIAGGNQNDTQNNNINSVEMKIEITNGIQDLYTVRIIDQSKRNSSTKVQDSIYHMEGINSDGTQEFAINDDRLTTDARGVTELSGLDIRDVFTIKLRQTTAGNGYVLDDTQREVVLEESQSTDGKKILTVTGYTNLPDDFPPQVDNLNNIINIWVKTEPKYTIRIIEESTENSNVRVQGSKYHIKGINANGTDVFDTFGNPNDALVTNADGIINYGNVDIQRSFKIELQQVQNPDGYALDDIMRTVELEESVSETGQKIVFVKNQRNLPIDVVVDNVNNIISIRIATVPTQVSLVMNIVDIEKTTKKLQDAYFVITDVATGKTYQAISNSSGIAQASLLLKPNGRYKYTIMETSSPLGYLSPTPNARSALEIEIEFKDNNVQNVTKSSGGNFIDVLEQRDRYVELEIRNEKGGDGWTPYSIQVIRRDARLNQGIANAQTKVQVINTSLTPVVKEDKTNTNGAMFMEDAITGPGETSIVIEATAQAEGYIWNTNASYVTVTRDPQTRQIIYKTSVNISSSKISIDHYNKLITITIDDTQINSIVNSNTKPIPPFTLQLVSTIHGTSTPIEGTYSVKITPSAGNTMANWGASQYQYNNKRTEYTTLTGVGYSPWHPWEAKAYWPIRELGTVTLGGIKATGEIDIEITEEALPAGMVGLPGVQHIKVKRDEHTNEFTILQQGENCRITYIQNQEVGRGQDKLIVNLDVTPYLTINIEKQDSKNNTEKLEGVEFTVTANNSSKSAKAYTDQGGNIALRFEESTIPKGTIIYTIKETKLKDSYKSMPDIQLKVNFTAEGRINGAPQIISGNEVAYVYFPEQIYTPDPRYSYPKPKPYTATNYEAYHNTLATKVIVNNDNTFDIRIKNIDKDSAGTPVPGSKFEVTMYDSSGQVIRNEYTGQQLVTDSYGMLNMNKIKGLGNITIKVKQVLAGEGYKKDDTETTFTINKGEENYGITPVSGKLDKVEIHSTSNEGIVTLTVENERNTGLNIEKVEASDSNIKLAGAKFTVDSQIIQRGTNIVNEPVQQVEMEKTTDANGLVSFGLGKSEPNTTVVYTIKETLAPTGYKKIGNIRLTIEYDAYGKIKNRRINSARARLLQSSNGATNMQILNGNTNVNSNGENVLPYKLNIQKTDSKATGLAVDNATYRIESYKRDGLDLSSDENGLLLRQENVTTQSSSDGLLYRKGVAISQDLIEEGHIRMKILETSSPQGYLLDPKEYILEFNCEYEQSFDYSVTKDLIPVITLDEEHSVLHGKKVFISNNGDITLELQDDSGISIGIKTAYRGTGNLVPPNAKYRITSYEEDQIPINLQGYSPKHDQEEINRIIQDHMTKSDLEAIDSTNASGWINIPVGQPLNDKTIVYIIELDLSGNPNGGEQFEHLTKLAIKYDQYGKVEKAYMVEDNQNVQIDYTESYVGKYYVNLKVIVDPPGGSGGNLPYTLEVVKCDINDFNIRIPLVEMEVKVKNQNGIPEIVRQDYTDENGSITIGNIEASGDIRIDITEISAPSDRRIDPQLKYAEFTRDPDTGEIRTKEGGEIVNLSYEAPSGGNKIILYVTNRLVATKYNFVVAKLDENNNPIERPGIKFEIVDESDPDNAQIYETEEDGKIKLVGKDFPTDTNAMLYTIREIEAPEGYELNPDEIQVYIELEENFEGDKIIKQAKILKGNGAEVTKQEEQYVCVGVVNQAINKQELEIEKVDKKDEKILIPGTQFLLTDEETGTNQTLVTDENGKINAILIGKNGATCNYTLTELRSANGFHTLSEPIKFTVSYYETSATMQIIGGTGDAVVDTYSDKLKMFIRNEQEEVACGPISLGIVKSDKYDNDIKLEGAKLQVNIESTEGIEKITKADITDKNGTIYLNDLNIAGRVTIEIKEIEAPEGRQLDQTIKTLVLERDITTGEVTVLNSENADFTVDNANKRMSIYVGNELVDGKYALVLNKVDEDGQRIEEAGAIFEITQEETGETREYETNEFGKVILESIDVPETNTQRIKIKEKKAPEGYSALEEEIYLDVSYLHNIDKNCVDTAEVTKGQENTTISKLKDRYIGIDIKNEAEAKLNLEIEKVDRKDDKLYISGTEFEITDEQTGKTKTFTTDNNGKVIMQLMGRKTGECNYTIRETKPQNGYVDAQNEVTLRVQYSENSTPAITIVNGSDIAKIDSENPEAPKLIITNAQEELEDIGGYALEIVKEDKYENKIKLSGAKIRIDLESEKGVTGVTKTDITDQNGIIGIKEINASGNLTIKLTEIEAPENRRLDSEQKIVNLTRNDTDGTIMEQGNNTLKTEINNDEKKVTIHLENDLAEGKYHIAINKVDELNEPIKEAGIQFEIRQQNEETGNVYETDEEGRILLTELDMPSGNSQRYIIKEVSAPQGYKLNNEIIYLDIEYGQVDGEKRITNAGISQGLMADVEKQEGQYIAINIQNEKEDGLYIKSQVYIIDNNYIDRISPETTVKEFIENCESNGEIKIFDIDGNELSEEDKIGTGMTLTVSGQLMHKLAVIGDVNGDGKISVTDLAKLKLAYIGTKILEDEYLLAADVNYDKKLSITDIAQLKQYLIGMITF